MAWYENDPDVRAWLVEKYEYEPSTGAIKDRATGRAVGGVNNETGYRYIMLYNPGINLRGTAYAHRLAWFLHHGEWPSEDLDHVNHERADNRIENLRLATNSQNAQNKLKAKQYGNRPCHSRYKGVTWHKRRSFWVAHINHNGKRLFLGEFACEESAAEAYRLKAAELFGEFAYQVQDSDASTEASTDAPS